MVINSRIILFLFIVIMFNAVVDTKQFAQTKFQESTDLWIDTLNHLEYEPYTYYQDFESGEVSAWSSYPPAQDMAYDPYLYPGKISDSYKGICLCKLYNPSWNVPQLIGASKKLSMHLDNKSVIKFRYFVKTTNVPSWLGIDLGLSNGERIRARYTETELNHWDCVSFTLSDVLKLADAADGLH